MGFGPGFGEDSLGLLDRRREQPGRLPMRRADLGPGLRLGIGPDPAGRLVGTTDHVHEVAGQPNVRGLLSGGGSPLEVLAPRPLPLDLPL